jgi:hypothetical protein
MAAMEDTLPDTPVELRSFPDVPDVGRMVIIDEYRALARGQSPTTIRSMGRVVNANATKTRMVINLVDKTITVLPRDVGATWHYLTRNEQASLDYLAEVTKLLRERALFAPTVGAKRRILSALNIIQGR